MKLTTRRSAAAVLAAALQAGAQQPSPDPDNGAITLPPGFRATVFADNLGRLRFLTVAPNGDVYVKTSTGSGILALRDDDKDGRAETKATIGASTGTGIEYRDSFLYHSTNSAVLRYKMKPGELVPAGEPETVVSGLTDERQHNSKTFAFDDQGRIYVEVGSPSNSYGGPNDRRAGAKGEDPTEFFKTHGGFWRFDANKLNQTMSDGHHFATGLRHVLPVTWNNVSKKLFVVQHGRDVLNVVDPAHYTVDDNEELPAEEFHVLKEGGIFGWPFTYYDQLKKARMVSQ